MQHTSCQYCGFGYKIYEKVEEKIDIIQNNLIIILLC